jgi:hypothetical protein
MFYRSTGLKPARDSENQEKYPHLDHLSIALRDLGLTRRSATASILRLA